MKKIIYAIMFTLLATNNVLASNEFDFLGFGLNRILNPNSNDLQIHSNKKYNFIRHLRNRKTSLRHDVTPRTNNRTSIVNFGHILQNQGLRVSEHPAFGGVHHVHTRHSAHYSGRAIDVNMGRGIKEAFSKFSSFFDRIATKARKFGFHVLWKVKGHFDHIHIQT